jgi:glutamate 5-kinase
MGWMKMRSKVTGAKRWVVKIGSALLTADGKGLDRGAMGVWVEQMVALREAGVELVLVSSGAVAAGMSQLGWNKRPSAMNELQAAASLGQMRLVQAWESSFGEHGKHTAQILLTHDDLSDRKRYLNARSTLRTLVDLGVVPVINENDTVVTDEIRFGDNDTLAALVANLVEADLLVILTDRDGMFDADPRHNPDAQLIFEARADDPALDAVAGSTGGALGRGGMQTKLRAARLAARSGAHTIIIGGRIERVLDRLKAGERLGTLLSPERGMLAARKQWLAGHLQTRGTLVLDEGAVQALRQANKSLLPVGVKTVQGSFRRGEMVICVGPDGHEVARGLANYSALEAQKIIGQPSDAIEALLGYSAEPELVHRDNLVLV